MRRSTSAPPPEPTQGPTDGNYEEDTGPGTRRRVEQTNRPASEGNAETASISGNLGNVRDMAQLLEAVSKMWENKDKEQDKGNKEER